MSKVLGRSASRASIDGRDSSFGGSSLRPSSRAGLSSAAASTASTDNLGESNSDLRLSGDGIFDKTKSRASDDGHSETSSQRRKISKLFKKGKRRKSIAPEETPQTEPRAASLPLPAIRPQPAPRDEFQSEESLGLAKSVSSSLLTEDSDAEPSVSMLRVDGRAKAEDDMTQAFVKQAPSLAPAYYPPFHKHHYPVVLLRNISMHNSHAGYLTLSSPLIASETIDSGTTLATERSEAASFLEGLQHANTLAVAPKETSRSASPVGKLKDAFSPQRRSTSPRTTGNSDTSRPNTSGGGLGALFGGKPRAPKILENTALQESPQQVQEEVGSGISRSANSTPKRIITHITTASPIAATPSTLVTPPTPTDGKPASPTGSTSSLASGAKHSLSYSTPNVTVSPSGNMISHRRVRSATNPPSKLSNSISALTPTIEEAKTPGGTAVPGQSAGGFFSSVFSAAQNAATSFTTTIANTTAPKNKTTQLPTTSEEKAAEAGGEEVIGPDNGDSTLIADSEKRRPAVETLGSGNLSLEQLGITDSSDPSPMSSSANVNRAGEAMSAKAEDIAAQEAISAAYAAEKPEHVPGHGRSRSGTTTSAALSVATPPRNTEGLGSPEQSSIQRQGSIRSRLSGGRRRRHRGSSATTGTTVPVGASTTSLVPQPNGQRLNGTGFAVAPPKRNRDFHNLFKSVPEDDYLIEDYSAALQKEILLQGRLYVSEGHLCFSSNILGWVTNLVISFDEVVSVEKKSTAMLFPNGIVIQTLHARNIFASFLSRDSTYDLIIGIWKISHPNLKSSLNGVTLDGTGTGDKTEKADSVVSEDSDQDSDDEVYDEDADEEEGVGSFTEAAEGSIMGSDVGSEKGVESRKASAVIAQVVAGGAGKADAAEAVVSAAAAAQDFPGPATHAATECGDSDQHYDKLLIDTTIPAPLGKVYSMMFGPASGAFMRKWLIDDQKSTDLQMEDDKKGLGEDRKSFSYNYIKPLPGSIGPRQTRCNIAMSLEQFDLDKAVSVLCSTQTPDVPSGNAFTTKTRYCLSWGPANSTRLIMTFTVEWTSKSWLKGPIEKGANDGQLTYANSLAAALRTGVSAKPVSKPLGKGKNGKKRTKEQAGGEATAAPVTEITPAPAQAAGRTTVWDIAGTLNATVVCIFLAGALVYALFFRSTTSHYVSHPHTPAERIAAYEQIWRTEEAELWKWMEERVALDRVHDAVSARTHEALNARDKLVDVDMQDRVVDEAIRVTEERLEGLKRAVDRGRKQEHVKQGKSPKGSAKKG
ncbi:hypothetical protein M011DRAFT_455379 [Sporormia fimetaria CBS 119925]|uniref:VASt domain-containing protein n=1 Tax=Sporormia fimetaria CBS 119925 TaxID=1340428 RepID=A0A6A6VPZ7_9PLEO|nr:hypothetical protein M011DRAFT_455379 [Sporormia fimetaria CBS 119925]